MVQHVELRADVQLGAAEQVELRQRSLDQHRTCLSLRLKLTLIRPAPLNELQYSS